MVSKGGLRMSIIPLFLIITFLVGVIGIAVYKLSGNKMYGRLTSIILGLLAGINLGDWAFFLTVITGILILEIYLFRKINKAEG